MTTFQFLRSYEKAEMMLDIKMLNSSTKSTILRFQNPREENKAHFYFMALPAES